MLLIELIRSRILRRGELSRGGELRYNRHKIPSALSRFNRFTYLRFSTAWFYHASHKTVTPSKFSFISVELRQYFSTQTISRRRYSHSSERINGC
jgi:hypothetical protein